MDNVIEVKQVTKRYGRMTAVNDVSLAIAPGQVFALLGENGAGKTTLLRTMLGFLTPDAGSVSVLGLSSAKQGEAVRQRVGYVPERPTLYEWMTAAEIGWFTAGFYPDGFEYEYRQCLDRFRVPPARRIEKMSKGMRAKVSLALAMAPRPELLLLDEPTSGLDTLVRREFLESMVDWAAEGRTVLLSSHLIGEVERVADTVAIVKEGKLLLVEQLDHLKTTTREVIITLADGAGVVPAMPGEVVRSERRGRQVRLLLRGVADDTAIESLSNFLGVVAVESHPPSLEDVFIAYMQAKGEPTTSVDATPIERPIGA